MKKKNPHKNHPACFRVFWSYSNKQPSIFIHSKTRLSSLPAYDAVFRRFLNTSYTSQCKFLQFLPSGKTLCFSMYNRIKRSFVQRTTVNFLKLCNNNKISNYSYNNCWFTPHIWNKTINILCRKCRSNIGLLWTKLKTFLLKLVLIIEQAKIDNFIRMHKKGKTTCIFFFELNSTEKLRL